MSASPGNDRKSPFPDLYRLLGLEPLESNEARIEQALQRIMAKLDASDETRFARGKRVCELGSFHLLNANRKRKYDSRWSELYGQTRTTAASVAFVAEVVEVPADVPADVPAELRRVLPAGDPEEPFLLDAYLASFQLDSPPHDEAEFEKLLQMIDGVSNEQRLANSTSAVESAGSHQPLLGVTNDSIRNSPLGTTAPRLTPSGSAVSVPKSHQRSNPSRGKSSGIGASGVGSSRQRTHGGRWFLMVGSGVLVVLAVGLGGLVLRQQMGKRVGSSTTKQETAASTTAPASEMRASLAKSSQGSGLPKVKGLEGMEDRLFSAANDNDLFPIQAQSGELDSQLGAGELAGESTISASDAQAAVPMASQMNGELNAGADVSRPAESSSESSAAELARPEPEWTDEERASWRATMENLKQKIGSQDYTAAGEAIAEARRSAVRAAQRAQLDRLSKTNELARAFHTGLVAAIQGLSAGEVFTVGSSTQASFVEGDDQHVIVRIRGENQSFALTEVPIGLAYGLVDLKLDREQPSSLASKAAFTAVHPAVANNELAMVRAREMLSQAIAAGVVAEDMAEIFSEER